MEKIYRVLDANINRAMEGLRVAEEVARFIVEDKKSTSRIKFLRSKLKKAVKGFSRKKLLEARFSLTDVGGKSYTKEEKNRKDVKSIFKSNVKRAEESLRVLEEFSKLIDVRIGKFFKIIRYELYDIEKLLILCL